MNEFYYYYCISSILGVQAAFFGDFPSVLSSIDLSIFKEMLLLLHRWDKLLLDSSDLFCISLFDFPVTIELVSSA